MDENTRWQILELYRLEVSKDQLRSLLDQYETQANAIAREITRNFAATPAGTVVLVPELTTEGKALWVDDIECKQPFSFVTLNHL